MVNFSISTYGITTEHLLGIAQTAEEEGFAGLWCGEHVVTPISYESTGRQAPGTVVNGDVPLSDIWVTTGALLASTSRLRIATGVFLAPLRNPLFTAQAVCTIGRMFPDRFIFGVGVGWLAEEYQVLQQEFNNRGARLNEILEIVRLAMDGRPFSYKGLHYNFSDLQVSTTRVNVPIVIGGASEASLQRTIKLADGWYSPGNAGLDETMRVRARLEQLRAARGSEAAPLNYHVRIQGDLTGENAMRYVDQGFENLVLPWQSIWDPTDRHLPLDEKLRAIRNVAKELKVGSQ